MRQDSVGIVNMGKGALIQIPLRTRLAMMFIDTGATEMLVSDKLADQMIADDEAEARGEASFVAAEGRKVNSQEIVIHRVAALRRQCLQCDAPVSSAKFCSPVCRITHFRRRARLRRLLVGKPRCEVCRKRLPLMARTDARYCSPACRQSAYRTRSTKPAKLPKAHQRIVKDALANEGGHGPASLDIGAARCGKSAWLKRARFWRHLSRCARSPP